MCFGYPTKKNSLHCIAGLAQLTYVPFYHVYTFTQVRNFRYIHVCHNIVLSTVLLFLIILFQHIVLAWR